MAGDALMFRNFTIVQALRGLAAAWVVLFHASEGGHVPALKAWLPAAVSAAVFDAGHYGVAVFFALSGFVIAHGLTGIRLDPGSCARFMLRRSIRLDPAHCAAIAVAMAFAFAAAAIRQEAMPSWSGGQVAAHVFHVQDLLGYPALNPVFWTLAYEIQFYAVFAAAMTGPDRAAKALLCALAFLAAFGAFDTLPTGIFLNLWGCFFVGVLARWAAAERVWLAVLLGLALALARGGPFGAFSAATALLLYGAAATGWAQTGLRARPLQWLGAISYSLYLIHNPVSGSAAFVAHRLAGTGVLADGATLACICAASLAASAVLWRYVEMPSQRLSRRIALSAPAPRRDVRPYPASG